ncbi:hypothetical protein FLAV_01238 [Flavobacteriales bacterium]|nr:T9SS C-terminal target domain-containing protein [Bacteroidota bacterium]MBV6461772.1 hypothetical protein [Flavobacteriales bacterium]CAG0971009.1 hypothetical protein FLAV_01238 [Flavobacteriales bacterium]
MKNSPNLLFFLFFFFAFIVVGQNPEQPIFLNWQQPIVNKISENKSLRFLYFEGAYFASEYNYLPYYLEEVNLKKGQELGGVSLKEVEVSDIDYNTADIVGVESIETEFKITYKTSYFKKEPKGYILVFPVRKNVSTGKVEVLTKFSISFKEQTIKQPPVTNNKTATTSVLASGDWYKIGVTSSGVFKLTYNFLKSADIDVDNIEPKNIRVFGGQQGMLPGKNNVQRVDDLQEMAIAVYGENDGKFNKSDYILFYGNSPNVWAFDAITQRFIHKIHEFSDTTFYFITFNNGAGKRILNQPSTQLTPTHFTTTFDDYLYYEKDNTNLIKSGRVWLGEKFDVINEHNFSFNFSDIVSGSTIYLKSSVYARSASVSTFTISSGNNVFSQMVQGTQVNNYYDSYAQPSISEYNFAASNSLVNIKMKFNKNSAQDMGWLNYLALNVRRNLKLSGNQIVFRDRTTVDIGNITQFTLSGVNNQTSVWDISDFFNIKNQEGMLSGNTFVYSLSTPFLREFIVFNTPDSLGITYKGQVKNQNLHAMLQSDLIIVTHPNFLSAANDLASYRKGQGMSVNVASTQDIYNEFSGGATDIVAIRDFVRMFYERATNQSEMPKYLLLFGDGSYDNKNRINANSNFIPTHQSANSHSPTDSYVSDDYFGMLDVTEGEWKTTDNDIADVGIGRLPAKSLEEANAMVKKIKHYESVATMKDWRNILTFVADDEDGVLHMDQANKLSVMVDTTEKAYNLEKIFFDAYRQESTPGGSRYPDVNKAINERTEKGALIVNYTGHGGEIGWAHERVLGIPDIKSWNNLDNMPLFFTATCEFSRFDDPERTSAGELIMLHPNGAGIGLFTTVRLVYSSPNLSLNQSFYKNVFKPINGKMPCIGDVFRIVKASQGGSVNTRNFTLLADPSMQLAYPKHLVESIEINGKPAAQGDTIRALSKVTIKGFVKDKAGQKITNFNGVIYPTVYDKLSEIATLNNDGDGVFNFKVRNSKLFKGKASVINGDFSFSFVVPKDIAYTYGTGRASYYAENGQEDAHGYYEGFIVGGTSSNYAQDNTGPEVKLYMNDDNFVFGGITDENPVFYTNVFDEYGINMTGNGVGHDITAVLDGNVNDVLILNDFYESEQDSYQKGKIKYPFKNLSEGKHSLTLKLWDVYNNSTEASLDFTVVKNKEIALDKVYNYPNPFTTHTEFWFEHNQAGKYLNTQIQIYTISGKLVKTIQQDLYAEGYREDAIVWNGLDDFGDKLARGVYIYRLKVRSSNGTIAEKYEKLVIL